ncbi:MAG: Ca-activated chloride channel family protein [Cognaticolwellia sp.]|jgi:Ca-activated chloride channel family protein
MAVHVVHAPKEIWMFLLLPLLLAQDTDDEEESVEPVRMRTQVEFRSFDLEMAMPAPALGPATLSAQVGGTQDFALFRSQVEAMVMPSSEALLMEGLLSEHDLPPRTIAPCDQVLCVVTETSKWPVSGAEEVQVFAQLGFDTNIVASTWQRPSVDLTVLIDASGSMAGGPEQISRLALAVLQRQLYPDDRVRVMLVDGGQVSIIGEDLVPGEPEGWDAARRAVPSGQGWTELFSGVDQALRTAIVSQSPGRNARVMVISDQRPNRGHTGAQDFVSLARLAAGRGVGLTWLGVGDADPSFGAKVGTVRGGNALYIPGGRDLVQRFGDDLDMLVTPLAYDLALEIRPASGWRLAGVYGIPGQALSTDTSGVVRLNVATLFPSKEGGAIYLGLAPETLSWGPSTPALPGTSMGSVVMSYEPVGGQVQTQVLGLTLEPETHRSLGLQRGHHLVELYFLLQALVEQPPSLALGQRVVDWKAQVSDDPELASAGELLGMLYALTVGC